VRYLSLIVVFLISLTACSSLPEQGAKTSYHTPQDPKVMRCVKQCDNARQLCKRLCKRKICPKDTASASHCEKDYEACYQRCGGVVNKD